jgi:DNA gyrase subunit A
VIRIPCSSISILGRITTGVKIMDLKEGVTIASLTRVKEDPESMNAEEPVPDDSAEENEENREGND